MIKKHQVIQKIKDNKLIFILRHENIDEAEKIVEHAVNGGINTIELTMTTPGVLSLVERLTAKYSNNNEVLIGVGTVLDDVTARQAIIAGATFIVSPHYDASVIHMCNRYGIPVMPGTTNVSEVVKAMENGVDVIKLFPARAFGPSMIKDLKGPIPHANFIPTGGINLDNIQEWFRAGAFAVGVGRDIYAKGVESGDFNAIAETAASYVAKIRDL